MIKFDILKQSFVDVIKPILLIMSIFVGSGILVTVAFWLFGQYAPFVILGILFLGAIGCFIVARYITLMGEYRREQQRVVDILKK